MAAATFQSLVQGRLHAAKVNGGAAVAEPRGNGRYAVTGRAGARYSVFAVNREYFVCDCPAGAHGKHCWHAAAAFLRQLADSTIAEAA